MAAVTFATNEQIKAIAVGLTPSGETQLDLARTAAYSLIVSALEAGDYAAATFTDAPTAYGFLTVLEARLVALDLLGGGATSAKGKGGKTWEHWADWAQKILEKLEQGKVGILNDSTGEFISAPAESVPGLLYEERDPGANLTEETSWPEGDPLETYQTGTAREDEE